LRAFELLVGQRCGGNPLDHRNQFIGGASRVLAGVELRTKQRESGVRQRGRLGKDCRRKARLDQVLVGTTRRAVANDQREEFDRHVVRMGSGWHVVAKHHHRRSPCATQRDAALAVLRRVERIQPRQAALGLGNAAE
jgi:hypothetical protein